MSNPFSSVLDELADLCGIEPEYRDVWGRTHRVEPSVKRAILAAVGIRVGSLEEAEQERRRILRERNGAVAPPVQIQSGKEPAALRFRIPAPGVDSSSVRVHLKVESNSNGPCRFCFEGFRRAEPRSASAPEGMGAYEVPLPSGLDMGVYRVELRIEAGIERYVHRMFLVRAPRRMYCPPVLEGEGRKAGLDVALYGLRSARNWGVGDFSDLKRMVDWCRDRLGVSLIRINPLHAIHNRRPFNTSPYLPLSPLYFNPIYLDVETVPEVETSPEIRGYLCSRAVQERIRRLRDSDLVQYEEVARLKRRVLRMAFDRFEALPESHSRRRSFGRYLEAEGEDLEHFALFLALCDRFEAHSPPLWIWEEWPEEYRDPHSEACRRFLEKNHGLVRFHQYVQWELARQMEGVDAYARKRGLSLGILYDFPLAMDRCGCEPWAYPDVYVSGVRVGAPPDEFSPKGQDWGFLPFQREALRREGYRRLRGRFRKNCRPECGLRIDHVMRFFRLYWIPDGCSAAHGAYVRERWDELLPLLALTSREHRTWIVGEDLGTVPGWIRENLREYGVFSCCVVMFEKDSRGRYRSNRVYPEQAVISFSTHDLPTMAGFFKGKDIDLRRRYGLFPDDAAVEAARMQRERDRRALLHLLVSEGYLSGAELPEEGELPDTLRDALFRFMADAPSKVFLFSLEDFLKDECQQNVPGTTERALNWSHKATATLEELDGSPCDSLVRRVRGILAASGRAE